MKKTPSRLAPNRNGILLWSRFFNETTKDIVKSGKNGLEYQKMFASQKNYKIINSMKQRLLGLFLISL
jgi:hypothetical protein